ncbi:hypothetical protein B9T31_16590 [Acinetobacter sp. ANC 4558]|uniref:fimbria/pilus outer membrane usher protein n=1 Tax=Acinetobacter sp. ANC 4558 TaxID=1977876 RepID=UPI000A358542|nr:fimbria/pilus outer membrane usher protein [Acinetobacter sp. ANC 4558]OTG79858.1 hypothetical protein B9T31_16590 [Acinetobacter sp. ANC 4558]
MNIRIGYLIPMVIIFSPLVLAETPEITAEIENNVQQELYLDVILNQAEQTQIGHFLQKEQQLYIDLTSLNQFSIYSPVEPVIIDQTSYINLQQISGLTYQYDDLNQKISIQVPVGLLIGKGQYGYKKQPIAEINPQQQKTGTLLNYTAFAQRNDDLLSLNGWSEIRAFGLMGGVFSTSGNFQYAEHRAAKGQILDTYWEKDLPEQLLRFRLGDAQSYALPWTRSSRISGLSLSKNFALQPYAITTPLMSFKGQVALPSQVDLIINGIEQFSQNVSPGQFDIQTAPTITGAGNAQMVITDINGQQQVIDLALYRGVNLLAQGLKDWSFNLGYPKLNYGISSFDYGNDLAFSGNYRYGVSNTMTLQTHSEFTRGLGQAGLGTIYQLGRRAGVINVSYAYSHASNQRGQLLGLGYSWNSTLFSVNYNTLREFGEFNDIASLNGSGFANRSDQIYLGVSTKIGQFGGSYFKQDYREVQSSKYLLFNWSYNLPQRVNLNFSYSHNLVNGENGYYLSANIPWNRRDSSNLSVQRNNQVNQYGANYSHPLDQDQGGFGWQLAANHTDEYSNFQSQLDYLGRYGLAQVNLQHLQSDQQKNITNVYASVSGGLVMVKDTILPTRLSNGSFAIVSTSQVGHVPVHLENRLIGETNKKGYLLLDRLNPYQHNSIAINTLELPLDMKVETIKQDVVPAQSSGVFVVFPIYKVKSIQFQAVDQQDQPITVGKGIWDSLSAMQQKQEPKMVVAYDGIVYLDDVKNDVLYIGDQKKFCQVHIPELSTLNGFTDLGRKVCQ